MKKGISGWSFPGSMRIEDCFRLAADAGFDGVELCLSEDGEFSLASSPEHVARLGRAARDAGVEVPSVATGLYWTYSPTASDTSIRKKSREIALRQLEFASIVGADTVLYIPGAVHVPWNRASEVVDYETAYGRAREALLGLLEAAEGCGVGIAIENVWNKFLLSPLEMRSFIDEIGHPRVGSYLDVGNVLVSGYPEQWIRILSQRIMKVHVKDFKLEIGNIRGFTNLLQGDVNWPGVVSALTEVGYDGYLTAEVMPPYRHYPEKLVYDTSSALDEILARKTGKHSAGT